MCFVNVVPLRCVLRVAVLHVLDFLFLEYLLATTNALTSYPTDFVDKATHYDALLCASMRPTAST